MRLLVTNIAKMEVQMTHADVRSGAEVKVDIGHAMDPNSVATLRGRITAGELPLEGVMVSVRVAGPAVAKGLRRGGNTPLRARFRQIPADFYASD